MRCAAVSSALTGWYGCGYTQQAVNWNHHDVIQRAGRVVDGCVGKREELLRREEFGCRIQKEKQKGKDQQTRKRQPTIHPTGQYSVPPDPGVHSKKDEKLEARARGYEPYCVHFPTQWIVSTKARAQTRGRRRTCLAGQSPDHTTVYGEQHGNGGFGDLSSWDRQGEEEPVRSREGRQPRSF